MKTMTCNQLGGACELAFHAETFDEIAKLSQAHGTQMFEENDEAHMQAMGSMTDLMKDPNALQEWMASKKAEFEALPETE